MLTLHCDSSKLEHTAGTPTLPSSTMGLKPNWCSLIQANSTSSSPVPSIISTPHSTPLLAISQKVSCKQTLSHNVGTGAFTDKDLFEDPTKLSAWHSKVP